MTADRLAQALRTIRNWPARDGSMLDGPKQVAAEALAAHDAAKAPAEAHGDERAAFEAEMRCEETWGHKNLKRDKHGHYLNRWTSALWAVWQARAALKPQAQPKGTAAISSADARDFFERWALTANPDERTNWQIWSAAWTCAVSWAATQAPAPAHAEFTDTARAALLWVLWHHQGGSSPVGQPIRFALGMGADDRLNEHQIGEAKRWAEITGWTTEKVQKYHPGTAAPSDQSPAVQDGALTKLLAHHATLLEHNSYAYFELAYTRSTGWMAWITDKPAKGEPGTAEYARSRKVIARGQGDTPEEAAADALAAMGESDVPVQGSGQ